MNLTEHKVAVALAQQLHEQGVVEVLELGTFCTFSSGIRSPIKIHLERITQPFFGDFCSTVEDSIRKAIYTVHKFAPRFFDWAGVPTGGNAWASKFSSYFNTYYYWTEKTSDKNVFSVLSLGPNHRIICFEDVITSGAASLALVKQLRGLGKRCSLVISVFSYGFPEAERAFAEEQVTHATLVTFKALFEAMQISGRYSKEALNTIEAWHQNPHEWRPVT